jgi:hypothetical protein
MRPLVSTALVLVLAVLLAGCPRAPQPSGEAPPVSGLGKGVSGAPKAPAEQPAPLKSTEPPETKDTEETPEPALRAARREDHSILKPILAYVEEKGGDLKELASVPWLSVDDLGDKKPEDLPKDTVIYKITTEKGRTIVLFGPPWSEYGLQFNMAQSEAGEWQCTGHQELSGLEDFG